MPRPIHFEIPAEDPERAIAFYAATLGWRAERFPDAEYWLVKTGEDGEPGIDGAISRRRDREERATNVMGVDSVSAAMDRIAAAGGRITVPRMAVPGVGWVAYAVDTEGNPFGVFRPDPEAA
jgi:hypothetical protein